MRYGKFLTEETTNVEDIIATSDGGEYTDAVLRSLGFYPIETVGDVEGENRIVRYTLIEDGSGGHIEERFAIQRISRTFSKLKILTVAAQMGLANDFLSLLKSDALLYEMWLAAQNIAEDNQFFQSGVETIKQQLHLTDEQIESILKEATI